MKKDDKFLVFYSKNKQLILNKNHSNYLTTFKAIDRLNSYSLQKYDLEMFISYQNTDTRKGLPKHKKAGISYITEVLNSKDLVDLNKQIDDNISKYLTAIYDGQGSILW